MLLSSIAMRAPATKSSAGGISRMEIVSRECASWITPTLTASGSAFAGLTVAANKPSIAAKSARSAFKVTPSLREAGVWTGMASAKVFSSLRWKRVRRLSPQCAPLARARRRDARADEDALHVFPSEWRAKGLHRRRPSGPNLALRNAQKPSTARNTLPRSPQRALTKFNGNAALLFERPTLDGSHATHCAHRIGRPNHPPRAYRGVHRRRNRRR